MSQNKQAMRRAGRKIRRAFDNYITELEAALAEGVLLNCDRVMIEDLGEDGGIIETPLPDPQSIHFVDPASLKDLRFTFRVTETLEESEIEDEPETPPAA